MADDPHPLRSFLEELRRRKVYRVAVVYAVVGWVLVESTSVVFPSLGLPSWTVTFVIVLVAVGFPLALVLAWAFEVTPDGVRRTPEAEPVGGEGAPGAAPARGRPAIKALVGLGLVGLAGMAGWYLVGGGGETEPRAGERSIAVLPFDPLSEGEESETFARGIHDDLLTRLGQISDLTVSSRRSVQRYRDTELGIEQIADSLGVRWVLEGGVQVMGDQIQVNAQLVDPRSETQAWAESYQRRLTAEDLFALQGEITRQIAAELQTQLSAQEQRRIETQPTGNLAAYRLYVRARSLLDQRTEPEMRQAADIFERAIDRDSSYALAWVGLADARTLLADYGYAGRDTLLPEARRAARRALELSPRSAEAHASLGVIQIAWRQEGPAALGQLQRAVELRPSYAEAHNWMGWLYLLLGKPARALASGRRAVNLDPVSPESLSNLGFSYLVVGERDSVLIVLRRALDLQPGYASPALYEATALYELGRLMDARSRLRGLEVPWAPHAPEAILAIIDAAEGDSSSARDLISRLDAETPFYAGLMRAALGRRTEALSTFGRLEGWSEMYWPVLSLRYLFPEVLGPLRSEPRFRELLREVNRSWGLNPDGSVPEADGDSEPRGP